MPVITPGERDYLSDPSLLKENSKKNFIRENIKHLKQLERKNRKDKKNLSDVEHRYEMPTTVSRRPLGKSKSQSKLGRKRLPIESKSSKSILKSLPKSPTTQVELTQKAASVAKARSHHSKKNAKSKAIQSIGGGDGESVSEEEEVARNVSLDHQSKKKENEMRKATSPSPSRERSSSFSPFNLDDIKREMKAVVRDVDFIKLNQLVQYKKKYPKNAKGDPTKAPPTYQRGVLPKYLRKTKKEEEDLEPPGYYPKSPVYQSKSNHNNVGQNQSKKSKEVKEEPMKVSSATGSCPPGHILISDQERKQQLNEMRKQYAELINKLYRLPNDKKNRLLKSELERDVENLEAGIALFSKEKLFVKIA